jgi:hypothetical protein
VKKDLKLESFGLPKRSTSTSSEVTVVGSETGPHENTPAVAPAEVETAGIIDEKSFSITVTPGDSAKGIVILLESYIIGKQKVLSTVFII